MTPTPKNNIKAQTFNHNLTHQKSKANGKNKI